MKVIDLLNKIANGYIPTKIKYKDIIYKYDNYKGDCGYVDMTQSPYKWFIKEIDCDVQDYLNEEVEIIEEHKIPEKFEIYDNSIEWCCNGRAITDNEKDIMDKINEILDYLEEEKNGRNI
jgi:hypothetical protein